jgi:glycosyltransferase involved in cell wall biosynthesis
MKALKILHVVPGYTEGSITRIVRNIIEQLGTSEYQWFLAGRESGEMFDYFVGKSIKSIVFSKNRVSAMREIREFLRENQIELVHVHTPTTMFVTWPALLRYRHIPCLYTKHLLTYPQDRRNGWIYTIVDRLSIYLADYIAPVSETMGQLISKYPGIHKSRIMPVRNAIDYDLYFSPETRDAIRAEFGFQPDDVVVGFAGRIALMKRLDIVIDSIGKLKARHSNIKLLIVGKVMNNDNSLLDKLKARISKHGIENSVLWAGWRSDISNLLAGMDIYAQPSNNEGLSLSILEAMAAQKAVISTDVGAIREVITDKETGLIVKPNDLETFTIALDTLLTHPNKRVELARAARNFVKTNYSLQHMTNRYKELYTLISNPS